jgi:hypothetical protein
VLFLLNDTVLDLGVSGDTFARTTGRASSLARLDRGVRAGQEALFAAGAFTSAHPDVAYAVAAEIALASEANAALFVRPPKAKGPQEVAVRLASAPLTALVHLLAHQNRFGPDPAYVNQQVWTPVQLAGRRASA